VAELEAAGKTIREVAVELGLSKSTVGRLFKEIETVPTCPTVPRVPAALMRRKGLLPEEWELS
jgi:predicted transcriptional regulator